MSLDGVVSDRSLDGMVSDRSLDGVVSEWSLDGVVSEWSLDGVVSDRSLDGVVSKWLEFWRFFFFFSMPSDPAWMMHDMLGHMVLQLAAKHQSWVHVNRGTGCRGTSGLCKSAMATDHQQHNSYLC